MDMTEFLSGSYILGVDLLAVYFGIRVSRGRS